MLILIVSTSNLPPSFSSCPTDVTLYPEYPATEVTYSWEEPQATDTDGTVTSQVLCFIIVHSYLWNVSIRPSSLFNFSSHHFFYFFITLSLQFCFTSAQFQFHFTSPFFTQHNITSLHFHLSFHVTLNIFTSLSFHFSPLPLPFHFISLQFHYFGEQ